MSSLPGDIERRGGRPNIVYVMADDMRYDEMDRVADLKPGGGFDWMRHHATTFSKMWMNDNLCCPSRATALTGQTAFNTKVFDNQRYEDLENTLPMWLQKVGYCTGFTGKYLNLYNMRRPRPRGWTYWQPLLRHFDQEYGYTMLSRKGQEITPGDFITDRLATTSRAQLEDCLDAKKPAFVTYWPFAPHFGSNPDRPQLELGPNRSRVVVRLRATWCGIVTIATVLDGHDDRGSAARDRRATADVDCGSPGRGWNRRRPRRVDAFVEYEAPKLERGRYLDASWQPNGLATADPPPRRVGTRRGSAAMSDSTSGALNRSS